MKKIIMLLVVTMLLLAVSGQAMAAFENGDLIRVVYSGTGSGQEFATDLGNFSTLTTSNTTVLNLNTNNFSLASVGASSWDQVSVAYFMVTATSGGFPGNYVWASGPTTGQTGGGRNMFSAFQSAANSASGAYTVAAVGQNATVSQADGASYWSTMNFGGSGVGQMKGFVPAGGADQNLAALSTTGYVDQQLYFYNLPNANHAGLSVVNIRTNADGSTTMNGDQATIPVPPSFLLMGSGLLGLVGIGRKKQIG